MLRSQMERLGEIWRRLLFLLRRRRFDRDLEEELRFHLEMRARANREAGMAADEAAHAARRKFGSPARLGEDSREAWGWAALDRLGQDLRYAVRTLRRNPGFTLAAALTLALGIGANTAIFSLMYALLLRMLPVTHPEELKLIVQHPANGSDIYSQSYPAYTLLRDQSRSLAAIAAASGTLTAVISGVGDEVERASKQYVSGDFFATLGIHPFAGRFLRPEDDRTPGAHPVAVISFGYWQRKFNGNPAAVGASLSVDEAPYTILGVAPPGFSGVVPGNATDIWLPAAMMIKGCIVNPGCQTFRLLARVKTGITDKQTAAELDVIFHQHLLERARGLTNEHDRLRFLSRRIILASAGAGDSYLGRQYSQPLTVLMALVGLVLLLACANVANMLLARASARRREIAIRLAIGAGRRRLIRQLLTESVLLASAGGALGLLFALWGARALVSLFPRDYEIVLDLSPDLRVLAFTTAISLGSGLLFGLVPALRAARQDVTPALKGSGAGAGARAGKWTPGRLLVVSQVALSILLLVGAALFVRTLENLKSLDPGFRRENVLSFSVGNPRTWKPERADEARRLLLEQIRLLPGVVAASNTGPGPLSGSTWIDRVAVEGYPSRPEEDTIVNLMVVSPGFFETVRTPLLAGRAFGLRDRNGAVAVVNETFARYFFAGRNPLGMHIDATGNIGRLEIVGVVGDARYVSLREQPPRMVFLSAFQTHGWASLYLARTSGDTRALALAVRQVARQIDPALRIERIQTLTDQVDQFLGRERMLAKLSGFFGLLAVMMAALGLYGVMSYAVAQRTNEIGIRMALGARRADVLWMIVREALVLVAAGAAIGVPAVLLCGRFVRTMLFGLKPADPLTLTGCTLLLLAVALVAAYLPGRRAMRVQPLAALRYE